MASAQLDVSKLAAAYRRLVLWFGAQLAIGLFLRAPSLLVGEGLLGSALALGSLLGILVTAGALIYYAYHTASALGSRVAILWSVAMLIPLLNLLTLLVLSARATRACRQAGVPVGFFGPKLPAEAGPDPLDPSIAPR